MTTRHVSSTLENVMFNPGTRGRDLDAAPVPENTRVAYPFSHITHATRRCLRGRPRAILLRTAEASAVLPRIRHLMPAQALQRDWSRYTAKVTGTQCGLTEPLATVSTGVGTPFMILPPALCAGPLGATITRRGVPVWLVNTCRLGGPYGIGERRLIAATRAPVRTALDGALNDVRI